MFTFGETVGHKKRCSQLLFRHLETAGLLGLTFPGHCLVQKVLLTDPHFSSAKHWDKSVKPKYEQEQSSQVMALEIVLIPGFIRMQTPKTLT